MKNVLFVLIGLFVSLEAFAYRTRIHCKEIDGGIYEAFAEEGAGLTRAEIRNLPPAARREVLRADSANHYELTIFRGEAVPEVIRGIGTTNDVSLSVMNLETDIYLTTYLDELSERDNSSELIVDGKILQMSCIAR